MPNQTAGEEARVKWDLNPQPLMAIHNPITPEIPKPIKKYAKGLQCVPYLRSITKDERIRGWAGNIKPNSDTPKIGSVLITREGGGHVALVVGIEGNELILKEANYYRGRASEGRRLEVNNPLIEGYLE